MLVSKTFGHVRTTGRHCRVETARGPMVMRRTYAVGDRHIVQVPGMGDSISKGTVSEWLIEEGGQVNAHQPVVNLETDKMTQAVPSPVSGTVAKHLVPLGDDARVGSDIFEIIEGEATAKSEATTKSAAPEKKAASSSSTPSSAPATKSSSSASAAKSPSPTSTTPTPEAAVSKNNGPSREERSVKLSKMRQRIAQRLKDSQNTAAMLTTFNEVDMSALMEFRNKYKEAFEKKHGVKLGFMSAFVKAASSALNEFPSVNAVIEGDQITYRNYHDVSVAVATPTGLVVPVLRNVESMSFAEVEKAIADYGAKAKQNAITPEDMQGGTFTVSNGGVFGSLMGTPIINPPQSAILGMHATTKRAVVVNDQVVVRPMMFLALTYDHRIIDGREAVLFLKKIKSVIEDPQMLLLDM